MTIDDDDNKGNAFGVLATPSTTPIYAMSAALFELEANGVLTAEQSQLIEERANVIMVTLMSGLAVKFDTTVKKFVPITREQFSSETGLDVGAKKEDDALVIDMSGKPLEIGD